MLIANNQSHFDFLILSYIFLTYDIKPPYVQSSESLLNVRFITNWLKCCGGYFVDSSSKNNLYNQIIDEYLKELLIDGGNLEFFINSSRSRSGKISRPTNELL
jgi:glycerol-3-phosphate O-acyltransferase